MSYLDTLVRASKSPVTDLHLCILNYPLLRNDACAFFTSEPILGIWSKIQTLENELSRFEEKYAAKSENIYRLYLEDEQLESSEMIEDFGNWANTFQMWLTCQKNYADKFREFRRQQIDKRQVIAEIKIEPDQKVPKNNILAEDRRRQSFGQSGIDFLMSIAGMFDSSSNNTSENVDSIVSDFVLKKHRKTRDGSTN